MFDKRRHWKEASDGLAGSATLFLLWGRLAENTIPIVIVQADLVIVKNCGALHRRRQLHIIIDDGLRRLSRRLGVVPALAARGAAVVRVGKDDGEQLIAAGLKLLFFL